ncbi:hypothetical protein DSO57_1034762 [Entomophthora muscae]|uniref:Uncharacterized protein n=1 Tax=Entomophthora muscae TaxID=34485 RepID=A0ACC2TM72_9FUNG|nr:hypothetical protein DSO57_1034762 [Entomophthora muscae]
MFFYFLLAFVFILATKQKSIQYGDVYVDDTQIANSLKEVRGGSLIVEADGLRFPNLQNVEKLLRLEGAYQIPADAFPKLKEVGGIEITSSVQKELKFDGLVFKSLTVEDSALSSMTGLSDPTSIFQLVVRNSPISGLRFNSLTSIIQDMRVENCSQLVVQEMIPAITKVGRIFRIYNSSDETLQLPIQMIGFSFALAFNRKLTSVVLPLLTAVRSTLDVYDNPKLKSIEIPNLVNFGSFANFDPLDSLIISKKALWTGYSRFTSNNFCKDYESTFAYTNFNYTLGIDCSTPHKSEVFTHPHTHQ